MRTGLVIAVGDEGIKLKVNRKVLFATYTSTEFKMDGYQYLLLEASDVLANVLN
jgi:chaperonin GroES